ncbi:hypothetical protein DFJ73DRAFT_759198 [Zopfochytrium polystomum]|nr:hypothetical protein DFJ73DRAFT_759198 [Zopfochytrium polystomum]
MTGPTTSTTRSRRTGCRRRRRRWAASRHEPLESPATVASSNLPCPSLADAAARPAFLFSIAIASFIAVAIAVATPASAIFPLRGQIAGDGVPFVAGTWHAAKGTHYGPFPSNTRVSEQGFLSNDVGVGCSNGQPGGDPRWNAILANGTYPPVDNGINNSTVWPVVPVVAVSQRMYGGPNKNVVCFSTVTIRSASNASAQVTAHVVDFCPTYGCLWTFDMLSYNVDLYGQETWFALGGGVDGDGSLDLEIQWPAGLTPRDTAVTSAAAPLVSAAIHCLAALASAASFIAATYPAGFA